MKISRIHYLDYGRFLAIVGVILIHTNKISGSSLIPGSLYNFGRFGVQLFFIISGATIFMSYNSLIKKYKNYKKAFLIKRLFRIVPLFVLMAFIYAYLKNVNVFYVLFPLSGLNPNYMNIIEGGWSIWNEMYFYIFFPVYFFLRKKNIYIFFLSIFLVTLSLFINTRFNGIIPNNNAMLDFDYLNIFTQFICFVFGIEYMAKDYKKISIFFLVYFITGLVFKILFFKEFVFVADFGATYWTAIISLVCLLLLVLIKKISYFLRTDNDIYIFKIIRKLGQVTYTSYMIHFLVIEILANHLSTFYTEINFIIIAIFTFTISLLLQPVTENIWSKMANKIVYNLEKKDL